MPDNSPVNDQIADYLTRVRALNGLWSYATKADICRLLAAVEVALSFHKPEESYYTGRTCGACLDAYGEGVEWPCSEYQDISAALLGKEATDA